MKGNNEFWYFLAAGLLILAVLIAAFQVKGVVKADLREIGFIQAVKTFSIPEISAANILETTFSTPVSKDVFNGLLFGEDKIVFDLRKSDLQDVSVRFDVVDSNRLGRLLVRVNGKTVESESFESGQHIVDLSDWTADRMLVEIAAESSFWQIWAPNLYHIKDATLISTSFSDDSSQFKFNLGDEFNGLEFAKVDLTFRQNTGSLLVDMNGRNIWNSPVADLQTIRLEKSDLRLGDNIIKFSGSENSRFFGSGTIAVIFRTRFPVSNESGIITASQPLTGSGSQFYG